MRYLVIPFAALAAPAIAQTSATAVAGIGGATANVVAIGALVLAIVAAIMAVKWIQAALI